MVVLVMTEENGRAELHSARYSGRNFSRGKRSEKISVGLLLLPPWTTCLPVYEMIAVVVSGANGAGQSDCGGNMRRGGRQPKQLPALITDKKLRKAKDTRPFVSCLCV
jgi:hypothetical protein